MRRVALGLLALVPLWSVAAGCNAIAGLDGLRLDSAPPTRDRPTTPRTITIDAGSDGGADSDVDSGATGGATAGGTNSATTTDDGGTAPGARDSGTTSFPEDSGDEFCELTGTCRCNTTADCTFPGFECCGGRCTDVAIEKDHCGKCDAACDLGRSCSQGQCTCGDLDPLCEASCVDYQTNPRHCGRCGHSCLGGECWGSACQTFPIATKQAGPRDLYVDAQHVYFTNGDDDTVGRVLKAGPACEGDLCLLFSHGLLKRPSAITGDSANIYVASAGSGNEGSVLRIPKSLDDATELARSPGPLSLVSSRGRVFFSNRTGPHTVSWINPAGGPATHLVPAALTGAAGALVAADATSIVFASKTPSGTAGYGAYHLPIGSTCIGRTCRPLSPLLPAEPRALVLSGDWLLWASADGRIYRAKKTGGCDSISPCPIVVAEEQADPAGLVVDEADRRGAQVYWINAGDGTVRRSPLYSRCAGPRCQAMAAGLGKLTSIAADERAVYIASEGDGTPESGAVYMMAK